MYFLKHDFLGKSEIPFSLDLDLNPPSRERDGGAHYALQNRKTPLFFYIFFFFGGARGGCGAGFSLLGECRKYLPHWPNTYSFLPHQKKSPFRRLPQQIFISPSKPHTPVNNNFHVIPQ